MPGTVNRPSINPCEYTVRSVHPHGSKAVLIYRLTCANVATHTVHGSRVGHPRTLVSGPFSR